MARMLRQPRANAGNAVVLIAIAAVCWAVTADRMEGMDMGPGTELGGLGWFLGIWAVMMAAMMLPPVAPKATVPFAAGFLLPWIAVGFVAYGAVEAVRALDPAFLGWDREGPYVAGAVVVGAAIYELTSPKRTCLRRCRDPRMPDRPGIGPALRAGIVTGLICIGCCWALMAALFALGVMSVGWMVLVAALIAAEKLIPSARTATVATAALLAILGTAVAIAPADVPGLTEPDETMHEEMDEGTMPKEMDEEAMPEEMMPG